MLRRRGINWLFFEFENDRLKCQFIINKPFTRPCPIAMFFELSALHLCLMSTLGSWLSWNKHFRWAVNFN